LPKSYSYWLNYYRTVWVFPVFIYETECVSFVDLDSMTLAKLQQFILYGNQFIEHINCIIVIKFVWCFIFLSSLDIFIICFFCGKLKRQIKQKMWREMKKKYSNMFSIFNICIFSYNTWYTMKYSLYVQWIDYHTK
jgi:hypothetical protein